MVGYKDSFLNNRREVAKIGDHFSKTEPEIRIPKTSILK